MKSSNIITLAVFAAAAYALYEWLSNECSTIGSSMYGSSICGFIPGITPAPVAVAAPVSTPVTVSSPPVVATAPITATAPAPTPAIPVSTQMQNWANANGMGANYIENGNSANAPGLLGADHWELIYQFVTGNAIPSAISGPIFFPNGRPAITADEPVYTAQQFVQMLVSGGGSAYAGLSGYVNRVPMSLIHRGAW
jgi:hypothetical protein